MLNFKQDMKEYEKVFTKQMKVIFEIMFHRMTNRSERHMCSLMIDLLNLKRSSREDFAYLDGKVLLILSKDDETFSEKIRQGLIELMPNSKVCDNLSEVTKLRIVCKLKILILIKKIKSTAMIGCAFYF